MGYHLLFSMLVVITALASYINHKYLKLPKTIGLTIISVCISLLVMALMKINSTLVAPIETLLSGVDFRETLLNGMLGYLLFASALHINMIDLRKEAKVIISLASFGVLISAILIGFSVWLLSLLLALELPLAYCLIFGALISPTDPIAVIGVFKTTKYVPQKIKMRITGEALFNDAAGIILFLFMVNLFIGGKGNDLNIFQAIIDFIQQVAGGIFFGWALGAITSWFLRRADDPEVSILFTLSVSSCGFLFAQYMNISGAIAMVIAGLVVGNACKKEKFSRRTIVSLDGFWGLVDGVLNAFLFVLIGLEILTIPFKGIYILFGVLSVFAIVIIRYLSIAIPRIFFTRKINWKENILMSWGGIRGGISIALALSIPESSSVIISLTYIVVLISILVQGSTFKFLVEKIYPRKKVN